MKNLFASLIFSFALLVFIASPTHIAKAAWQDDIQALIDIILARIAELQTELVVVTLEDSEASSDSEEAEIDWKELYERPIVETNVAGTTTEATFTFFLKNKPADCADTEVGKVYWDDGEKEYFNSDDVCETNKHTFEIKHGYKKYSSYRVKVVDSYGATSYQSFAIVEPDEDPYKLEDVDEIVLEARNGTNEAEVTVYMSDGEELDFDLLYSTEEKAIEFIESRLRTTFDFDLSNFQKISDSYDDIENLLNIEYVSSTSLGNNLANVWTAFRKIFGL